MSNQQQVEIDHLRGLLKAALAEVARLRELLKPVEVVAVGGVEIEVGKGEGR